jgi:hypothetical protein
MTRQEVSLSRLPSTVKLFAICGVIATGCSDPGDQSAATISASSVAGQWCGSQVATAAECVGDEVLFVELADADGQLSGHNCEAFGKECYPLVDIGMSGRELQYSYEFAEYRVDAALTLGADGRTMSGTYFSNKCNCEIAVTLHRI